jgi:transposase
MSYIKRSKKNGKVYLSEVETKKVKGKVVTKHIRYVGKEVNGQAIISCSIDDLDVEQVKIYGPLLVLHHISKEIGLPALLGEYACEILSMVYAHCLDYESVNYMPTWFQRTDLNILLDLDDLTERRLLMALDYLEDKNPTKLQKQIFDSVSEKYNLSTKGIVYDVTNTYFCGKKCEWGKPGKDKEGVKGRPLIQVGLGVTQKEGVPVFHKVYHGNIHDSRTFQDMITIFKEFGINSGIFVFDRGISSKENQKNIKALKWKVLCGLPINIELKRILKETLQTGSFVDFKNRVKLNGTVFYVRTVEYSIANIKGKLAFCFNEKKSRVLKESRYDEINEAKKLLAEGKQIKKGLEIFFRTDGRVLMDKVRACEELDGYSAIFTTASLSKEKMVKMYFDKDLVEKAFQGLKGVINLRPIRHWLYNRVVSHVFICYLSYLLMTVLKLKLDKIDVSPIKALKELDTMYKVYIKDSKKRFTFHKVVATNKAQERILKTIDKNLLTGKPYDIITSRDRKNH